MSACSTPSSVGPRRSGLSGDQISRIERGARETRFDTIERIAEDLGVDARDLFRFASEGDATKAKRHSVGERMETALEALDPPLAEAVLRFTSILAGAVGKDNRKE